MCQLLTYCMVVEQYNNKNEVKEGIKVEFTRNKKN